VGKRKVSGPRDLLSGWRVLRSASDRIHVKNRVFGDLDPVAEQGQEVEQSGAYSGFGPDPWDGPTTVSGPVASTDTVSRCSMAWDNLADTAFL
jgi:hypothetical protein